MACTGQIIILVLLFCCHGLSYNKTVWTYWDGTVTSFISYCINITKTTLQPDWKVNLLTPHNLSHYLSPEDTPSFLHELTPQLMSDYIRLNLVYRYGGMWMDASTIITSHNYMNQLFETAQTQTLHLLAYCNGDCKHKKTIETGVFLAPKGSIILKCWIKEMDTMFEMGMRNYFYHVLRHGRIERRMFKTYPQINTYFAVYVTSEYSLQHCVPRRTKYETNDVYQFFYRMDSYCHGSQICLWNETYNMNNLLKYPITKYWSGARQAVDPEFTNSRGGIVDTKPFSLWSGHSNKNLKEFLANVCLELIIPFCLLVFILSEMWLELCLFNPSTMQMSILPSTEHNSCNLG